MRSWCVRIVRSVFSFIVNVRDSLHSSTKRTEISVTSALFYKTTSGCETSMKVDAMY